MQRRTDARLLGLSIIAVAWAMGCGETVEDISRIQPHYVTKADLDGQWYFRQTVVDMPPTTGAQHGAFDGIEGAVEKIRWEVRETQLIAYRIHPAVPGLEDEDRLDGATYDGEPVAIYAITSHFDIVRDFDRNTGEQSNVLVEDSALRPWYERDHMRVDWSSNDLPGPVDLGGFFSFDIGLVTNSDWIRETEQSDPDHAQVDPDFIFLTTWYVIGDYGATCFFNYGRATFGSNDACHLGRVKVRSAFAKIDPEAQAQFEPKPYLDRERMYDEDGEQLRYVTVSAGTDKAVQVDVACTPEVLDRLGPAVTADDCRDLQWDQAGRFGFFRTMRQGYDRRVGGGHDLTREYYANHHQIWAATRTESGATIPLAERALRPVVYHLNPNFPDDLKAVATRIGHAWNDAFMEAAMAATGRDAEAIGDQLARDHDRRAVFMPDDGLAERALFQIRENTCSQRGITAYLNRAGNDPMRAIAEQATGGEGLLPGNLEAVCSQLTWHSKRIDGVERFVWQQMGDPRFSFVWWVHDDQPYGPLGYGPSSADAETGQIISGNAYVYGAAIDRYARDAADMVRFVNGETEVLDIRDGYQLREWLLGRGTTPAGDEVEISPEFRQIVSERIGTPFMSAYRGFMGADGQMDKAAMLRHMRDRLRHTAADDPMAPALAAPLDPGRSRLAALTEDPAFRSRVLSPEMLQLVGPLFGWQPGDEVPAEMEQLALELAVDPSALSRREEARRQWFAERNVFLPEGMDDSIVGQALELAGLPPEEVYRILREEIFEAVMLHEIGHTVGLTHNFEASMDALNYQDDFWHIREQYPESEWDAQRLPEYRYASIMDYGSRFNSDTKGLGKYDHAAIKFVYGHHVETFADDVPVPGRLDLELRWGDYAQIPELLGGDIGNLWNRTDRPVEQMLGARKDGVRRNGVLFAENPDRPASDYWIDPAVPYHYCADFLRGDLKCRTWDEGANHTEAVESAIQRYWNYYAFNSFRRKRNERSFINGYFGRQDRLREYLSYPWKYYYFYDAYPVPLRDDLLRASVMGLNFINQVLGTPEPGEYCAYNNGLYLPAWLFNRSYQLQCDSVSVQVGEGRDPYLGFSDEHVYRIDYIGVFYDKANMLLELFDDRTRFFRLVDDSDSRQYAVSYYRAFSDELVKLSRDLVFGAVLNFTVADGDIVFFNDTVFNRVIDDGVVRPQRLVDPERVAAGEPLEAEPLSKLYTPVPFNVATQALIVGTIYSTTTYDQRFDLAEYLAVVEVGSGDDRTFADGADVAEFVHPMTGQIYRAAQTVDGRSIAYEFLQFAQRYVETDWEPARRAYDADPNNAEFREDYDIKNRQLQNIFEMIDFLRYLRAVVDWGQ